MSETEPANSGLQKAIENASEWDFTPAMEAVRYLASTGQEFEAFDVTEQCGVELDHPSRWGALFAEAKRRGVIEHCGYGRARRPGRSGGLTRFWRGCARS
ncbi:hypothetical protein [Rhodococcus sp. SORGH_AS_0303]|uniref:hypothetical protein n=1 Tax=Rhodococcus sp. SORGH_AS_0303 TaxID=3041753 RepID=UPI002787B2D3|nr:hypothetical protein [Rhodococcus sp. SORGH_AS_0303]MDQ1201083.1 hypothetical protein [Rhodococcus sp. SORGH_AS_0303]